MRALHAGLALSALVTLWQAAVWLFDPPSYLIPSPMAVAAALAQRPGLFVEHGLVTLGEILAGFLSGTVFGIATAFGLAALPRVGQLVWPMVLILQALPVFVLAPILVLWLGFGMASKVAMTTIIIFFPVASAFADGLRRTDRAILDAVSLTAATHWQALVSIRAPLALPGLVSGLRVAAPLAPLGAVIGEWVGASAGLGFVMVQANARMQTDSVFAAMAMLAVLTILLRIAVDRLTAGLTPWVAETDPTAFPSLRRRTQR
ncbi:ABC transporter permease [Rhizobium sp. ARZ01]|uniref:ABC transporter permease n=1 Tax=Rhizobium sp. ARZ01 TaxID=2769313 RepID=UPI00177B571D|nr:ABC transporter permease [Rhizobium sp. ARZ01]MBD9374607.1 ABC transporter permease [Rhizobium sp. ARZ01]